MSICVGLVSDGILVSEEGPTGVGSCEMLQESPLAPRKAYLQPKLSKSAPL